MLDYLQIVWLRQLLLFHVFLHLFNRILGTISDTSLDHKVHAIYLKNFLCKDRIVIMQMILYLNFVPFLADPALSAVTPIRALFDVIIAEDSR